MIIEKYNEGFDDEKRSAQKLHKQCDYLKPVWRSIPCKTSVGHQGVENRVDELKESMKGGVDMGRMVNPGGNSHKLIKCVIQNEKIERNL